MIWNAEKLLRNKEKAMKKIAKETSWGDLYPVLKATKDDDIRRLLVKRLHDLNPDSMHQIYIEWRNDDVIREAIFDVTDDEGTLFRMATNPRKCPEAVDRLKRQDHLVSVINQFREQKNEEYALRALRRIEDPALLRQLAADRYQSDGVRRECVRRLSESPEEVYRMAVSGEGCLPAVDLLDQEFLLRLAMDKDADPYIRSDVVQRIEDEEQIFRIGEAARAQGSLPVLKAAAGRLSDPKRRCALGIHNFVPEGKEYAEHCGDTRFVYQDLRCTVCGKVHQDLVESYKF